MHQQRGWLAVQLHWALLKHSYWMVAHYLYWNQIMLSWLFRATCFIPTLAPLFGMRHSGSPIRYCKVGILCSCREMVESFSCNRTFCWHCRSTLTLCVPMQRALVGYAYDLILSWLVARCLSGLGSFSGLCLFWVYPFHRQYLHDAA